MRRFARRGSSSSAGACRKQKTKPSNRSNAIWWTEFPDDTKSQFLAGGTVFRRGVFGRRVWPHAGRSSTVWPDGAGGERKGRILRCAARADSVRAGDDLPSPVRDEGEIGRVVNWFFLDAIWRCGICGRGG